MDARKRPLGGLGVSYSAVDEILCPKCDRTSVPAAIEGMVMVCGKCGGTLAASEDGYPIRSARLSDIERLDLGAKKRLQDARRPLVRRFHVQ